MITYTITFPAWALWIPVVLVLLGAALIYLSERNR